ncbi:Zn-finger, RING domain containing protein [Toxoplasma gondii ME49]|uniref:Nitric oxide synthase-interacting protein n=11 Tax=Toxoplasma gondii TaxID=5811 RepID=A0A125YVF0_TOXGV|nr:Zn-finger, RING domain containing protein [Toxoplasma gondii ME49]EPR63186.1 Zn-finger, RING domain containing protein [Toxoplasma gondii GT1]ESS34613.1 Zn-finger, RING domain containing protein [Toxoplasma gondii VEG]KAF4638927.1 Zn-finger, RING domain containing protein [Toxoplasma gondii]KFG34579.1 Zn-finger, RING domain containing protein [Toxoplasma gondii GAB2-2007-GAL-DOM2]KFH09298.1 Zn-finger, RING domain containing protein [Toxoplasma gondii VAND]KYF40454.1 Zn-finger, RING domain |eukprot:XP_018635132.1 Zn-finger, RING domain containing protein [Toxoplasma gondii ME49]
MPARHSKNATSAAFYSYHERKKLKDVGTQRERLDTDALRRFEACWLCNRTALAPVCTPQGLVYCKQCLFFNFEDQKKRMAKELKEWEAQQIAKKEADAVKKMEEASAEKNKFLEEENKVASYYAKQRKPTVAELELAPKKNPHLLIGEGGKAAAREKSFWAVENTPSAPPEEAKPPKRSLECPITRKPLKLKQLVYLNPELLDDKETEFNRWSCKISKRAITNQKAAAVIPTGDVILMECIEKYVLNKKGGFYGDKVITKQDIIPLVPGGTGYSSHNTVEGVVRRACIQ